MASLTRINVQPTQIMFGEELGGGLFPNIAKMLTAQGISL
ncbi:hypothetical protein UNSWDHB_2149 [Dehalobacter sp. UNSWDHB]|nr:hypothetical protein DHBDCA_p1984 [Dehalobacter sp. DCA]AFV05999.1 hypothetical protein DCF50_p1996 [Dehalobacter sp. CF]EQB20532.1 hypothetical protein UNSWDHB_2149 [Dehalobacter sp. UNSWDHB]